VAEANPYFGKIAIGPLASATVSAGQLLRPYPQYQNVLIPFWKVGDSTYNSLQARFEKRLGPFGDTLMINYTWSKLLSNVGAATAIGTFAAPTGSNGIQDWNNVGSAKGLDPNYAAHRLEPYSRFPDRAPAPAGAAATLHRKLSRGLRIPRELAAPPTGKATSGCRARDNRRASGQWSGWYPWERRWL